MLYAENLKKVALEKISTYWNKGFYSQNRHDIIVRKGNSNLKKLVIYAAQKQQEKRQTNASVRNSAET